MKRCPTCQAVYTEDANFCGADGAELVRVAAPAAAATDRVVAAQPSLSVAERIERLHELYARGLLHEFEYLFERRKILAEGEQQ